MTASQEARQETLQRLARTRAEVRDIFEPPETANESEESHQGHAVEADGRFVPRSRTMKLLASGRGMGTVGALAGGLLLARPALAWRLLRLLPVEAVARVLLVKALTGMRSKR